MMRFGPAGYPQGSKNPEDGFNITKSLGLDALEVEFVRGEKNQLEITPTRRKQPMLVNKTSYMYEMIRTELTDILGDQFVGVKDADLFGPEQ